jgi:4-hydroxy-tetrahydrodipicolinate reductase
MTIRIIVNGASGKMGYLACQTIDNHAEFELVASLGRYDNLSTAITSTNAQIVVDLTRADSVYKNSLAIIDSGACPVIGTSGLTSEQIVYLTKRCTLKELGGIIVPNFSISAVLMMRFVATVACYLPDVEIIEAHHPKKFDAPSGTAIKTAEMIAQARQQSLQRIPFSTNIDNQARGELHHGVAIHSLRLPGILAQQQVIFGHTGETLTLGHQTIDRISFMPGIVLCCQKVQQFQTLYYGLEHVLDQSPLVS